MERSIQAVLPLNCTRKGSIANIHGELHEAQPAMPLQVYHQWRSDDPEALSDNLGMLADQPLQDCYDFGGNLLRMNTSPEFTMVGQ